MNANNGETRSKCTLWLSELKKGCAKVRDMFGIELNVDWRKDLLPETEEADALEVADER